MSGTRQHILPKFLIKGFSSRINGDEVYSWSYRKGVEPFETNVTKISVSKNFYENKNQINVDEQITDYEGVVAPQINKLRTESKNTKLNGVVIPDFITHLMVRTKHLRDSIIESSEILVSELMKYFEEPETLKAMIIYRCKKEPSIIKKAIGKYISDQSSIDLIYDTAVKDLSATFDPVVQEFANMTKKQNKDLVKSISLVVKNSHLQALRENIIPIPRSNIYRSLNWYLIISEKSNLILGDMGPVSYLEDKKFKAFWDKSDKIKMIFLPISNKHLIIGSSEDSIPDINLDELNFHTAECSKEFFISSENNEKLIKYSTLIGKNCNIFSEEDFGEIISTVLEEVGIMPNI